jgi:hypothetical protein
MYSPTLPSSYYNPTSKFSTVDDIPIVKCNLEIGDINKKSTMKIDV